MEQGSDASLPLTPACRLSIYLGNADTYRYRALSAEILHRAHRAGIAGATTLLGIQGYGQSTTIHTTPRWAIIDRTPVTVHLIDTPQKIRHFLPSLEDLSDQCLIVLDELRSSPATTRSFRLNDHWSCRPPRVRVVRAADALGQRAVDRGPGDSDRSDDGRRRALGTKHRPAAPGHVAFGAEYLTTVRATSE